MQPKTPKLLEDIRDAAAFIGEAMRGKALQDYERDRLLRQAIERNFEIIGEAMNRLAQHDPEVAGRISKHRRIIDLRNVLIHEPVRDGGWRPGRAWALRRGRPRGR